MEVFIWPNQVEFFRHKVALMSKHLPRMPKIEFSEPFWAKQYINTIDRDYEGRKVLNRTRNQIQVVKVTIEEIKSEGWILVADIRHKEGITGMVSSKYFSQIPKKFGLDYKVCDYCGKSHSNRTLSHIIYNENTGEWKQIGSTCVSKMFGNDYLNQFVIQMNKVVDLAKGCYCGDDFDNWLSSAPDHSWQIAYKVEDILPFVFEYRKQINSNWEKVYWDDNNERVPGTTDKLWDFYASRKDEIKENPVLYCQVLDYVNNLESSEFNDSIKDSFRDGYILWKEVFKVFFAVKMYEDSLTEGDWQEKTKDFEYGKPILLKNVEFVSSEYFWDDYYRTGSYDVTFKNADGIVFLKSFSSTNAYEKFKNADGTYTFSCPCGRIDNRRRQVILKGRCSKAA